MIELGGKQYKVCPNDIVFVDRRGDLEVNDMVECKRVLLLGSKDDRRRGSGLSKKGGSGNGELIIRFATFATSTFLLLLNSAETYFCCSCI